MYKWTCVVQTPINSSRSTTVSKNTDLLRVLRTLHMYTSHSPQVLYRLGDVGLSPFPWTVTVKNRPPGICEFPFHAQFLTVGAALSRCAGCVLQVMQPERCERAAVHRRSALKAVHLLWEDQREIPNCLGGASPLFLHKSSTQSQRDNLCKICTKMM